MRYKTKTFYIGLILILTVLVHKSEAKRKPGKWRPGDAQVLPIKSFGMPQEWRNRGKEEGGGACPPDFGRSINPISTKGGKSCPHISACNPRFLVLAPSLGPCYHNLKLHYSK